MRTDQQTRRARLFVGGRWVDAADHATVSDVFSRQAVATVAVADERLVDEALGAAHDAFRATRGSPAFERAAVLSRAAAGVERRRQEFVDTIVAEAGKPVTLAEAEVARAVITLTTAAEEARRFAGEMIPVDAFPPGKGHIGFARRFPVGVVYGITPFNFPLNLVAHKVAPAIASGNAIVVKLSPKTPLSALLLAEIMHEAGLPPGALNVIVAPNELAARPLADERVTLELGGNAGVIVHEDADLAAAVPAIATGGFGYAGQSCIGVQRVVVHAPAYERFRDDFVRHVRENVHAGDPRDRRTLVGPLI